MLGHSVSRSNGLNTEERYALLKEIVNSGALTKAEIKNNLPFISDYDITTGPVDKSKKTAETHRGPSRIINWEIAKDGILPSQSVEKAQLQPDFFDRLSSLAGIPAKLLLAISDWNIVAQIILGSKQKISRGNLFPPGRAMSVS